MTAQNKPTEIKTVVVFLNTTTSSFQTITYARKHPEDILSVLGADKTKVAVNKLSLLSDELIKYQALLDCFNVSEQQYIGTVTYDKENKFNYFSYPTVGMKDEKAYLNIGADSAKCKAHYVPLVYDNGYTLAGKKVNLTFIKYENQPDATPYLTVSHPGYKFFITLRLDKDVTEDHVQNAFDTGNLHLYLNPFSQGSICKFTTMFRPILEMGLLPENGIFMVLQRGKITRKVFNSKITASTSWKVGYIHESVANLPMYDDKGKTVTLKEASFMYASEAADMTKDVIQNNDLDQPLYYVVVTGKHISGNMTFLPSHNGALTFEWLPLHLQPLFLSQYQEFMAKGEKKGLDASNTAALPASSVAVASFVDGVVDDAKVYVDENGVDIPF